MEHPFISENLFIVVKKIAKDYPDVIFCGSFGLVYNGLLKRKVNDIDILVKEDYFHNNEFYPTLRINSDPSSETFKMNDDEWIDAFKVEFPIFDEFYKVDVLYNKKNYINSEFDTVNIDGIAVKIEKPKGAMQAKLRYLQNDKSERSFYKHLLDMIYINGCIQLHDAVENSKFFKSSIPNINLK